MGQITKDTEPRLPFLLAVFFSGSVLLLCAGKGWLPTFAGWIGNFLMSASIGWQLARMWYLR